MRAYGFQPLYSFRKERGTIFSIFGSNIEPGTVLLKEYHAAFPDKLLYILERLINKISLELKCQGDYRWP